MDGHKSRLNEKIMLAFLKNKISILCTTSHTTHLIQPNDSGFNKSIHASISIKLTELIEVNEPIEVENVVFALISTLNDENIIKIIKHSFSHTGIWPKKEEKRQALLSHELISNRYEQDNAFELSVEMAR